MPASGTLRTRLAKLEMKQAARRLWLPPGVKRDPDWAAIHAIICEFAGRDPADVPFEPPAPVRVITKPDNAAILTLLEAFEGERRRQGEDVEADDAANGTPTKQESAFPWWKA